MNRLGIFSFQDSSEIIDDYIIYLLQDIKQNLQRLVVAADEKLADEAKDKFAQITDDIFVRQNKGFDVGGWKEALIQYIGWDELRGYDELVLFNDTFYGPFYSWSQVFNDMEQVQADFWGLTVYGQQTESVDSVSRYDIAEHLQTYFLVIRKNLLHSFDFKEYWESLPYFKESDERFWQAENSFTRYFYELGYDYSVYCDTRKDEQYNEVKINHCLLNQVRLLRDYKCPVIKKEFFLQKKEFLLRYNYADEAKMVLDYIKKNYAYDTDLILRSLLRTTDPSDFKNIFGLDYILPSEIKPDGFSSQKRRTAVFFHSYYPELIDYCLGYLENLFPEADVYITTDKKEKRILLEKKAAMRLKNKVEVMEVDSRGRDLSALLLHGSGILPKYDYCCFIHDKKSARDKMPITIGTAFCDLLWTNMLGSRHYIENIINLFEQEPLLGLLVPPQPYHGPYLAVSYNYWTDCFKKTREVAGQLGIKAELDYKKPPVSLGTAFWCRPQALKKLWSYPWILEDFPEEPMAIDGTLNHALERIFAFAAQDAGFYTGCVLNDKYAAMELANFKFLFYKKTEGNNNAVSYKALLAEERRYNEHLYNERLEEERRYNERLYNERLAQYRERLEEERRYNEYLYNERLAEERGYYTPKKIIKRTIKAFMPAWLWNFLKNVRKRCR